MVLVLTEAPGKPGMLNLQGCIFKMRDIYYLFSAQKASSGGGKYPGDFCYLFRQATVDSPRALSGACLSHSINSPIHFRLLSHTLFTLSLLPQLIYRTHLYGRFHLYFTRVLMQSCLKLCGAHEFELSITKKLSPKLCCAYIYQKINYKCETPKVKTNTGY